MGVKLHAKNHEVQLYGRRKLKTVNDKIIIEGKEFDIPKKLFKIIPNYDSDFIFITTKLYDLESIIKTIKKNKIKGKIFVGIQNGLVDVSKYSKQLGKKIIPVVVFSGFSLNHDEIHVTPTPIGWVIEDSKNGREISKILLEAGIPCRPSKKFDSLRAEKTIVNCCLNGLSGIENKTFKELFKNKKIKERILKIFNECYTILSSYYSLDSKDKIKERMFLHWNKLDHHSSTCQDILSGRKTEIDFFNGHIVNLGKAKNLPIEENQKIVQEVKEIVGK